jgi:hypothetical protein
MTLRKKALALAVSAAVVGGGVSLTQSALAQDINPGGFGQALIYPYLTANNGWNSFLHVVNTSPATVAAKVRFRTATNSADAYDFVVVLSPYDMWTGVVEQVNGQSGFRPTDNTCTVPHFGRGTFTPFIVQSSEVYAEVIMMGVSIGLNSDDNPIAVAAKHNTTTGLPADCAAVEAGFATAQSVADLDEFDESLNADFTVGGVTFRNVLMGKFDLTNVGTGQSGAGRAVAIEDFGAPTTAVGNLAFANTNMWSQSPGDWDHPTLAEAQDGLSDVNLALNKQSLTNEWVLNPNLGELSTWIVTFPTKQLTVDAITAINASDDQTTKLRTFGTGTANCVVTTPTILNREERILVGASPGTSSLCNEVNVINFRHGAVNSSSVLASNVAVTVDTTLLGSATTLAGWMNLAMPNNGLSDQLTQTTLPQIFPVPVTATFATTTNTAGRPAVGFNLTARATPDDAVLYDHAYVTGDE